MNINLNITLDVVPSTLQATVNSIKQLLLQLQGDVHHVMADITSLTAQVAQTTSIEQSALVLIQGLAAQLAAAIASEDPAALQTLQDQLNASATSLAAAVAANTTPPPAPPAPPPAP